MQRVAECATHTEPTRQRSERNGQHKRCGAGIGDDRMHHCEQQQMPRPPRPEQRELAFGIRKVRAGKQHCKQEQVLGRDGEPASGMPGAQGRYRASHRESRDGQHDDQRTNPFQVARQ